MKTEDIKEKGDDHILPAQMKIEDNERIDDGPFQEAKDILCDQKVYQQMVCEITTR